MVPPVLGIVGPTASGKTDLALAIAERIPVEIVVADSRQVYRGMDIGTAKVSTSAQQRVPHHLIDVVDPDEPLHRGRLGRPGPRLDPRDRGAWAAAAGRGRNRPVRLGARRRPRLRRPALVSRAPAAPGGRARDRWPRGARRAAPGSGSGLGRGDRSAQPATGAAGARARGGRRRRSPAIQRPTPGRSRSSASTGRERSSTDGSTSVRESSSRPACSRRCGSCERRDTVPSCGR